jgi:hypothetical protein
MTPLGTYSMYKVHMFFSGDIKTAVKHELVKGIPDFDFQDLYDCYILDEIESSQTLPLLATPNACSSISYENIPILDSVIPTTSTSSVCKPLHPENNSMYEKPPTNGMNLPVQLPCDKENRFAPLNVDAKSFRDLQKNKRTEMKTCSNVALVQSFLKTDKLNKFHQLN